jgi:hypothetical protein
MRQAHTMSESARCCGIWAIDHLPCRSGWRDDPRQLQKLDFAPAVDKSGSAKRQQNDFTIFGIECHVLERRATENYFTASALGAGKGKWALAPYEKLGSQWSKSEGWKIASRMQKDDLNGTDLGDFLDRF